MLAPDRVCSCRLRRMLRLAMKAIPLRHDAEPLEVLFEDDHLLALNKPPGVLTAPKHRYMVKPPRPNCSHAGPVCFVAVGVL
jgi:23S rRNA-/tRNA-specific pseudouridylate synthase